MGMPKSSFSLIALTFLVTAGWSVAGEPPNPFGTTAPQRTDAVTGTVELSNGKRIHGQIYLTRGHFLRLFDSEKERFRDVPLRVVKEIHCIVEKEWDEKEWRFKENANDEKVFTGRTYPSRIYVHEIKLQRSGEIRGPLNAVVYVVPDKPAEGSAPGPRKPLRFLLHKRDKGPFGMALKDLIYVKRIVIGDDRNESKSATSP